MSVQILTDVKEHDLTHIQGTNGAITTPHTGSIQYHISNGLIRSSNKYSAVENTDLNFRDGKRKESQMLAQLACKDTTLYFFLQTRFPAGSCLFLNFSTPVKCDIHNTSVSES